MSCGKPHATDCREVIEKVYLYLDREIGEADCERIRVHLDECLPCLRAYGLEEQVKLLVHRACGCEQAPDGLRLKVMQRIESVRLEWRETTEA